MAQTRAEAPLSGEQQVNIPEVDAAEADRRGISVCMGQISRFMVSIWMIMALIFVVVVAFGIIRGPPSSKSEVTENVTAKLVQDTISYFAMIPSEYDDWVVRHANLRDASEVRAFEQALCQDARCRQSTENLWRELTDPVSFLHSMQPIEGVPKVQQNGAPSDLTLSAPHWMSVPDQVLVENDMFMGCSAYLAVYLAKCSPRNLIHVTLVEPVEASSIRDRLNETIPALFKRTSEHECLARENAAILRETVIRHIIERKAGPSCAKRARSL